MNVSIVGFFGNNLIISADDQPPLFQAIVHSFKSLYVVIRAYLTSDR